MDILNGEGGCIRFIINGRSCSADFCPSCRFATMCDRTCNICEGGAPAPPPPTEEEVPEICFDYVELCAPAGVEYSTDGGCRCEGQFATTPPPPPPPTGPVCRRPCASNAQCEGPELCACDAGYRGDGYTCTMPSVPGPPPPSCPIDRLTTDLSEIQSTCCALGECSAGPPVRCDFTCAGFWNMFAAQYGSNAGCETYIEHTLGIDLTPLAAVCSSAASPWSLLQWCSHRLCFCLFDSVLQFVVYPAADRLSVAPLSSLSVERPFCGSTMA